MALILKGYRILARNWRVHPPHAAEIDIIARRGNVIAFIEVKARPSGPAAALAVTSRQKSRIANAATAFVQRHPGLAGCDWRFDAILVSPWHWPRHLRDAWRPGLF